MTLSPFLDQWTDLPSLQKYMKWLLWIIFLCLEIDSLCVFNVQDYWPENVVEQYFCTNFMFAQLSFWEELIWELLQWERLQFWFQKSCKWLKGILHQKNFYRLNLIFWIVMGCGIARFGRRGLKTTETWKFWSQNLSPGVLRRGAPGVSRHSTMGFRGEAQGFRGAAHLGFRGAAPWGFEGQQHW